jgi:hypothetical protein
MNKANGMTTPQKFSGGQQRIDLSSPHGPETFMNKKQSHLIP